MKRFLIILASLIFLFSLVFTYFYFYFGLKEYIQVISAVSKLPAEQQTKAKESFYDESAANYYSGTIAKITTNGYGGVWVWGNKGLKYFASDGFSVYSFFSVCKPEALAELAQTKKISVDRNINTEIKEWGKMARVGNYVNIIVAVKENGGNIGMLREAKAYDWRVFMPTVDIKKQCGKL